MTPTPAATPPTAFERLAAVAWRALVIVAAAAVILFVLVELRLVVLPVIGALLLATILAPAVGLLTRSGWRRMAAVWTVLVGAALVLAGLLWLVVPQVADEVGSLDISVGQGLERVEGWLEPFGVPEGALDDATERGREWLSGNAAGLGGSLLGGVTLAVEIVAGALLAIVLLFFFLKDGRRIWRWIVGLAPERHRTDVDEAARRAWESLGAYVRGTAVVALADAVLIGIVIAVLGVPLLLPLVALTFLGGFFPLIGAVAAGSVAALVALVSEGPVDALILVAAIIVIQQVEGDVLQPLILGRAVRLHPVAILLSLTAGAALAGIVGAFLAVPIAAVAATVLSYSRERAAASSPHGPPAGRAGPRDAVGPRAG